MVSIHQGARIVRLAVSPQAAAALTPLLGLGVEVHLDPETKGSSCEGDAPML